MSRLIARRRPCAFLALALIALLCCASCTGSGRNKVHGKVLFNKEPIQGAVVIFHPRDADVQSQRPSGVTAADGTFSLTTGTLEGAAPGDYLVTVTWPAEARKEETPARVRGTDQDTAAPEDRLNGRYASTAISGLEVTIRPGTNQLAPFELK